MTPALLQRLRPPRPSATDTGRRFAVVVLIAALVVVMVPRRHEGAVPLEDYGPELARARERAPYAVLVPEGLPRGWRPVSARVSGGPGEGTVHWHLGFHTTRGKYAAVEQANGEYRQFADRMTIDGKAHGRRRIGDVTWTERANPGRGHRSLVRTAGGTTVVVTGTAGWPELARLAGSLRPAGSS